MLLLKLLKIYLTQIFFKYKAPLNERQWQAVNDSKNAVQVFHLFMICVMNLMIVFMHVICSFIFSFTISDLCLFSLFFLPPNVRQHFDQIHISFEECEKMRQITNNRSKCGSLPAPSLLSSLSVLFYSLVHLQCRTMQCRRAGWRLMTGLSNMMTHQSRGE